MGRLVRFTAPRNAEVIDFEDQLPGGGEVLLQTWYSGIFAGTELTAYRGSNPYLNSEWKPDRHIFVPGNSTDSYPLDAWGATRRSAASRLSARASTQGCSDSWRGERGATGHPPSVQPSG